MAANCRVYEWLRSISQYLQQHKLIQAAYHKLSLITDPYNVDEPMESGPIQVSIPTLNSQISIRRDKIISLTYTWHAEVVAEKIIRNN